MTFGEVIRTARTAAGLTQAELGRRIGVSGVAVGQWENGVTLPRGFRAQRLIAELGIDAHELLSTLPSVAIEAGIAHPTYTADVTAPLSGSIAAGKPIEEQPVTSRLYIPPDLLERHPRAFYLHVDGESMNRLFPNGSYALVDPEWREPLPSGALERRGQARQGGPARGLSREAETRAAQPPRSERREGHGRASPRGLCPAPPQ